MLVFDCTSIGTYFVDDSGNSGVVLVGIDYADSNPQIILKTLFIFIIHVPTISYILGPNPFISPGTHIPIIFEFQQPLTIMWTRFD